MKLLIDQAAGWMHAGTARIEQDERRYYLAPKPALAIIVCRNPLQLGQLNGRVVDAAIGWDDGTTPGMARVPGQRQTKITIYRVVQGTPQQRLSQILQRAPREETQS